MQDARELETVNDHPLRRRRRLHPLQVIDLVLSVLFVSAALAGGIFITPAVAAYSLAGASLVLLVLARLG